jgi:hypothetical protein
MGFSGSDATQYVGSYFTGRKASDPAGEMGIPVIYKAGEGPYNNLAGGTNRWGDYSVTSLDPADETTLWTIQEYARAGNKWDTHIAELAFQGLGSNYCGSNPNSTGSPGAISASGSASSSAGDLSLSAAPVPNQNGVFFHASGQIQNTFGNGFLCVSGNVKRGSIVPVAGNVAGYTYDNSTNKKSLAAHVGTTRNFQYWHRDPMGGGAFFNTSNGITISILP